jgi:acetyltransferase
MAYTSYTSRPEGNAGAGLAAQILRLRDGRAVILRAARSDDAPAVQQFVRGLSPTSRRNRFFGPVRELSPDQLDRVTRSRGPHELALVVETMHGVATAIVAMAQYALGEPLDAECAVVVGDAYQRQGLGIQLLGVLAEHAVRAGFAAFAGFVLADNWPMLSLLARLECELVTDSDPYVIRVVKRLDARGSTFDGACAHRAVPSSRAPQRGCQSAPAWPEALTH